MALSIQMLPQQHPRPVQLPLRRPAGDVEHRRNLTMLVALHVVEREISRAPGGSCSIAASKSTVQVGTRRRDSHHVERQRIVGHPLALNRKRSPPLDDNVDREAVEPR